jgi:hypothetical protein
VPYYCDRMTMDEPESRSGKQPRVGESRAPVGSILSIVLAVVAVIVGFVILRQINDDDDGNIADSTIGQGPITQASDPSDSTTSTTDPGDSGRTTTTAPPGTVNTFRGARVVVANASGVGGSASTMSEKLGSVGFRMGDPEDAGGDEARLDVSKVYYVPSNARAQAVADTVARSLRIREVAEMPAEIPTLDGEIDGAVLVMLGTDKANADPRDLRGN